MFKNTLRVFTDGACIKNGKIGAIAGVGIYSELFTKSFVLPGNHHSNQRAELYAIYDSLKECKDRDIMNTNIHIVSDSMYSINCITVWCKKWLKNNWNDGAVKNRDIIEPILSTKDYLERANSISFQHIRSHKKPPPRDSLEFVDWYGNDQADKLAVASIQQITNTVLPATPNIKRGNPQDHFVKL